MTRRDFLFKWLLYGLGLLPVWALETLVLNRVPLFGTIPMLLPLAAVAVAVREGAAGGAGFGLFVGLVADAAYPGVPGGMILGLTLCGAGSGALAQYVLRQSYFSCFFCALLTLVGMDTVRVVTHLVGGVQLPALLAVAVPEVLWSMVFTLPVYGLFYGISKKVGGGHLS